MLKTIILISFLFCGCNGIKHWQTQYPDNPIEESIEGYLERRFQRKIDLSPFTGNERHEFNEIGK